MQKDYLRRTSVNNPDKGPKVSKHPHLHSYKPTRANTAGSIKDNSGAEVTSDRVILYIHGKLLCVPERPSFLLCEGSTKLTS
jgi:hypothetical protein